MNRKKGEAGYLLSRKRQLILKAVFEFGIVAALLILGITQTKTRANLLTVVAILGCLPASKVLVQFISIFPYKSIEKEKHTEISEKSECLSVVYDTVVTSHEKILPIDCMVVCGNMICGYAHDPKTDPEYAAKHIKQMLSQNGYTQMTVKLFSDYVKFITRVEGLNNIRRVEKKEASPEEEQICNLLLNISM